jgi:hypothetical protein
VGLNIKKHTGNGMKPLSVENMFIIPEQSVKDAAKTERYLNPNNTFDRLLKVAREFRRADLTPVFLYDEDEMNLYVTKFSM